MEFLAIIPTLFAVGFIIFCFVLIFNPKLMGKFVSRRFKANKYMINESKDVMKDLGATMGKVSIAIKKEILEKNEKDLKDIADKGANISKDSVKVIAGAIKEGFTGNAIFCKHCGSSIDEDSKFCKNCGKEQ